MITLSPGVAQGCFELLDIADRNILTFAQIRSSFNNFGSISSTIVIEAAQSLKWVRSDEEGFVKLTPSGVRLHNISGYEPMLRQALLDYVEIERPAWIQNAAFGRMKVISFVGNHINQVIVEAGLASGTEEAVVSFWDSIATIARGQKNDRLTAIGRQGERLTIAYERRRTGCEPKWIAIDNSEDGYDVLSIVDVENKRPLSIEVKASTIGQAGSLHLTRNEWNRAQETEDHVFHLWDMRIKREPALATVSPADLDAHVPSNRGHGSWELLEIPFHVFKTLFFSPLAISVGDIT